MTNLHWLVGTLVLVAYLALTVANVLQMRRGQAFPWARQLSFAAAGLLALQYVLGFSLLGSGEENSGLHYVFALAALVTVGMEHGYAGSRPTPTERSRIGAVATGLTFLLLLIAYGIGEANAS